MPLAFVLINAEIGSEDEVAGEMRKLGNVKESYVVYGVYDIVAKVEADIHGQAKRNCYLEDTQARKGPLDTHNDCCGRNLT